MSLKKAPVQSCEKSGPPVHYLDGQGDTKTMEQMNDYGNIRYISPEGEYEHRPVRAVFCVFPGDDHQELLFPMRYGMMLQLYPEGSSENVYDIVGKEEFIQELETFLS